ncbi:MAG: holo-ACP synthase [Oscillospiraceae bacterium]|jgi:holo-[acyl-carrier protein] synthase|nr:holo-ACP synthase [Oscillospiraceae bacterium]
MILGIGIDLCEVPRMREALKRENFLPRFFTEAEQAYILGRGAGAAQSLAGHFAAKEAALKALGCGIALPLKDIAVAHEASGAPRFVLTGQALARMAELGGRAMHLSITHTGEMAAAVAVLEG